MPLPGKRGQEMKLNNQSIKKFLTSSAVPILFIAMSTAGIPLSGFSNLYLVREIVTRLSRDSFLVLSLIIPVMAGMGINFGMTLGAMAGQIGLVFITDWGVKGAPGLLLAALVGTPIAILLGYFGGVVLNRAKGREMITSMMLSFFVSGIYQFFMLYICGSIIPIKSPTLLLSRGYGIRNAITLNVAGGFDTLLSIKISGVSVPLTTYLIVAIACVFIVWFRKTKLGQDMRAVGQDMTAANDAGIKVDKTRIESIIISTVLACYGQIVYLQNIGTLNTYNGADQASLYAAASLLIGGATVSKATIPNALLGTALFHLMFIVMPMAGKNLTGSAMIGEYFRMFISYGIVTTALVLHAWKRKKDREIDRAYLRYGVGGSTAKHKYGLSSSK